MTRDLGDVRFSINLLRQCQRLMGFVVLFFGSERKASRLYL